MTLTEFLSARLDEDEASARAATLLVDGTSADGVWSTDALDAEVVSGDGITIYDEGGHSVEQATHIARHDPARVLREVEAKRAIVAEHPEMIGFLAAVYDSHPDYDEAWRP